jgi:hypothetical protein
LKVSSNVAVFYLYIKKRRFLLKKQVKNGKILRGYLVVIVSKFVNVIIPFDKSIYKSFQIIFIQKRVRPIVKTLALDAQIEKI